MKLSYLREFILSEDKRLKPQQQNPVRKLRVRLVGTTSRMAELLPKVTLSFDLLRLFATDGLFISYTFQFRISSQNIFMFGQSSFSSGPLQLPGCLRLPQGMGRPMGYFFNNSKIMRNN